jgi:predicted Zn-dependent peptidase
MSRRGFVFLSFFFFFLLAALAPAARAGAEQGSDVVLSNGLRVILIPHRANPMIASSVVVSAGVIHEPEGMNGASHFLEHLLFNGTETRSQKELYDEVDRLGAYNNATTREDHTLFSLLVQKEHAEQGLAIQADMLFRSTIPEDKFEKEKGIVQEEIAKDRNEPSYLAEVAFREFAYAGTPLSRPVLGSEASIGAMKRDDVFRYYKARYVPGNMILVVMGDFDPPAMTEMVKRTFGAAPRGAAPPAGPATAWPKPPERNVALRSLDSGRTYLEAGFPLPLAPHDPQMAGVEMLLQALSSGEDAPLARSLQSGPSPLVLSFTLGVAERAKPWPTVELSAVLPPGGDWRAVLDRFAEGIASLREPGGARERLAAVRSAAEADEVLTADQIHYYAMFRAAYLPGSPTGYLARRASMLDEAGSDAVDRAADLLAKGIPSARALVAGKDLAPGEVAWAPVAARAPATTPRAAIEETLPSGLLASVERSTDSQVFAAHLLLRPRAVSEPAGKEGIADFLHRMLLRGTIVHDAASLSARLDALGARVKLYDDPSVPYDDDYTTPGFSFVRLELPGETWREGIALLAEIVRFPALRDEDVEAVRREMLDLLARRAESTRAVAQDLVASTLAPGSPLSRPVLGTKASIASITAADLRAFHRRYVTGSRAILTVVGPVACEEVIDGIRASFGDLPKGAALPADTPVPVTPPGAHAEGALGKDQAYVTLAYVLDVEERDRPALAVAGALLSDALAFHLREEKGLAYSIGAGVRPFGGRMRFDATMGTRQANVDEAIAGLRAGIAEFVSSRPTAADVERARNQLRGRLLMRRLTRINQAYFAGLARYEGRPAGDDLARLEALLAVTPEQVAEAARKYLDASRAAVVTVR